jgi:hypothetical protein
MLTEENGADMAWRYVEKGFSDAVFHAIKAHEGAVIVSTPRRITHEPNDWTLDTGLEMRATLTPIARPRVMDPWAGPVYMEVQREWFGDE